MIWYIGIFWILLIALFIAAQRWGRWPEKAASACYLAAATLSVALRPELGIKFHALDWSLVAIDTGLLCALLVIALRADRWWPMLATALQAVATLSHFAKIVDPTIYGLGYQLMEESSAYPTLLVLAWAIFRAPDRREGTRRPV
ncbi:hypothetical protein [Sphingomonas sp.]|jgi:hypothetical protein|uniref:hypothetical protein n=1 Tax=Sphingomonas sp. TaxID=28214 RepID=UPI002E33E11C|nr:hypothetical protein [Sphingomonas sp.]HEX4693585.1 hypothetical protein [Sphingomonas sp.]